LIDLLGVEFIASLGLRLLFSSAKGLKRHEAKMVLLNPQPSVENVLKVSGFDEIIPIVHAYNEAIEILKRGSRLLVFHLFWYFMAISVMSSA
jgi:anti-anti-sigma regulatory factor